MTNPIGDFGRWAREVTALTISEQVRALRRFDTLVRQVARGELSQPAIGERFWRFSTAEGPRYLRDLAFMSAEYLMRLADLNRAFNDRMFDQFLAPEPGAGASSHPTSGPPQSPFSRVVSIGLEAPAGQVASRSFILENPRPLPSDITFVVSDFHEEGGTKSFSADAQFHPARLTLEPHGECVVTLQVPVTAGLFEPGHLYRATALVRGFDDLELNVSMRVQPPLAAGAQGTMTPGQPAGGGGK
jgi:hypothetical protein